MNSPLYVYTLKTIEIVSEVQKTKSQTYMVICLISALWIRRCNLRRTYFPVSQKRIIILKSLIIGIGWDMLYYQESHKGHSQKRKEKKRKFSQISDPLPPYGNFCLILSKLLGLFWTVSIGLYSPMLPEEKMPNFPVF